MTTGGVTAGDAVVGTDVSTVGTRGAREGGGAGVVVSGLGAVVTVGVRWAVVVGTSRTVVVVTAGGGGGLGRVVVVAPVVVVTCVVVVAATVVVVVVAGGGGGFGVGQSCGDGSA